MKGSTMLKVVSIIMIVFAAIGLIAEVMAILGMEAIAEMNEMLGGGHVNMPLLWISLIISFVNVVLSLFAGISGVSNCNNPEKASGLMKLGILIIILQLLGAGVGVAAGGDFRPIYILIGLVLPVLYVVGCVQLKSNIE